MPGFHKHPNPTDPVYSQEPSEIQLQILIPENRKNVGFHPVPVECALYRGGSVSLLPFRLLGEAVQPNLRC